MLSWFCNFLRQVLDLFDQSISRDITLDLVTILVMLSGWNHAALMEAAKITFDALE